MVNPNNPDGRHWTPEDLRDLAKSVGRLIIDESFADPVPQVSLSADAGRAHAGQGGLIILRSFGKFAGLAGLRLGFLLASPEDVARLSGLSGPWSVSGPACAIGAAALADTDWHSATTARLTAEVARLDVMAAQAGWPLIGGAQLSRTYARPKAGAVQTHLAKARIRSRISPCSAPWVRFGLPGTPSGWARPEATLLAAPKG